MTTAADNVRPAPGRLTAHDRLKFSSRTQDADGQSNIGAAMNCGGGESGADMAKKESIAREVLSVVADFVSTFITTIVVIVAAAIVVMRLMGWNMYSVDSYSMTPTYPINSLVVVKPVEPETIQVGDVVTYVLNEDGVLVTHRVTAINRSKQTFTTKGDANESEDASPVLWGNVVGKVVIGFPGIGALLRILTSEENRPIVIGVIVGLLVLSFGWDIVSGWSKKRKARKPETVSETPETIPAAEESDSPDWDEAVTEENDLPNWDEAAVEENDLSDWNEAVAEESNLPDWDEAPVDGDLDDEDIEYFDIDDLLDDTRAEEIESPKM